MGSKIPLRIDDDIKEPINGSFDVTDNEDSE